VRIPAKLRNLADRFASQLDWRCTLEKDRQPLSDAQKSLRMSCFVHVFEDVHGRSPNDVRDQQQRAHFEGAHDSFKLRARGPSDLHRMW